MQTETEQSEDQTDQPDDDKLGTRAEVENLGACKRRIKAVVPAEKVAQELERSYKELAGVVRLPGFRPGRVPRGLLEARFGEEIENELEASLKANSFSEVLEEKELRIVGEPAFDKVKFEPGQDFEYEAEIEVRPDFELPKYKGLEVERDEKPVTEEDIDERLESLRKRDAKRVEIEPLDATDEDFFLGEYSLKREGEEVKTGINAMFRPSSDVLDEFHVEGLAEKVKDWDRAGDAPFLLRVVVPQGHPDEGLRGQELDLEFRLEKALRNEYPEIDDEWATAAGAESVSDLRATLRESLVRERSREADRQVEEKLLELILDATTMDMPETLIEGQRKRVQQDREQELLRQGIPPEEVKEKLVAEGDQVLDDLRHEMKSAFVLSEIADKEKIFVTERELKTRLELLSKLYGIPSDSLNSEFAASGRIDELRVSLRYEKTREHLRKKATVKNIGESPEKSEGEPSAVASEAAGDTDQQEGGEEAQ